MRKYAKACPPLTGYEGLIDPTSRRSEQPNEFAIMIKDPPKYDGLRESCEVWNTNSRLYLEQFPNATESRKIASLLVAFQGTAREIAESKGPYRTVEEQYCAIRAVFGTEKNHFLKALGTKQESEESIQAFVARLQCNLNQAGLRGVVMQETALELLLQGARLDIAKKLQQIYPTTLEQVVESRMEKELKEGGRASKAEREKSKTELLKLFSALISARDSLWANEQGSG
jgi:hypothetical protein